MKNTLIEDFRKIGIHDLPIVSLEFNFEKQILTITLNEPDGLTNEYKPLSLKLSGVNKFTSEYPKDLNFTVFGCKDATCSEIEDGNYEVKFILEIDDNLPVWNLTVGFTSLIVERSLSAKSIEFKDMDFSSRQEEKLWFEKNNLPTPM